jgi:hypothetical protein
MTGHFIPLTQRLPHLYYGLGSMLLTISCLGVRWARQHGGCTVMVAVVGAVVVYVI